MTHPAGTPCPFADDDFPIGPRGTCCSLYGETAARNLVEFRLIGLAMVMGFRWDQAETPELASSLRAAANGLEQQYAGQKQGRREAPKEAGVHADAEASPRWSRPWFEEAIASLRKAADWYEKVARLGFGVDARE